MFNIAFCDDNAGFLSLIISLVKKQFQIEMPDEEQCSFSPGFGSGREFLAYLENNKTDVLFLDIDMPEMSGFELAKIISRDYKDLIIVFMSAYDNFVYQAFDYQPFAYMRKEHLAEEIPKVVRRIANKLLEPVRYITLTTAEEELIVDSKDVLFFESDRNKYIVHLVGGKEYACRGTISSLEAEVEGMDFYRVHSAYLINLEHVERVTKDRFLVIENVTVPIAQRRAKGFRNAYFEYTRKSVEKCLI